MAQGLAVAAQVFLLLCHRRCSGTGDKIAHCASQQPMGLLTVQARKSAKDVEFRNHAIEANSAEIAKFDRFQADVGQHRSRIGRHRPAWTKIESDPDASLHRSADPGEVSLGTNTTKHRAR